MIDVGNDDETVIREWLGLCNGPYVIFLYAYNGRIEASAQKKLDFWISCSNHPK
jgi:hypothetical protein